MPRRLMMPDVQVFDDGSSSDDYIRMRGRRKDKRDGSVISHRHHHHVYEDVYQRPAANLVVPGGRQKRAASTSGAPQPQIIIKNNVDARSDRGSSHSRSRSRSRERYRPRSRSRGRRVYEDRDEYIIERRHISPTPSRYRDEDYEIQKKLERLKAIDDEAEMKRQVEEQKLRDRIKKEDQEKREKEAVEKWKIEQEAKKQKEKKEKEEQEKRVEEALREKLRKSGASEAYIEAVIKGEKKDKVELQLSLSRPKHIKVRREYLLAETLEHFNLPWYYLDEDYLVIEEYIDDRFQDELFEHTRRIKERKLLVAPNVTKETILKVKDKHGRKDKMYVVRKKSPAVEKRIIFG